MSDGTEGSYIDVTKVAPIPAFCSRYMIALIACMYMYERIVHVHVHVCLSCVPALPSLGSDEDEEEPLDWLPIAPEVEEPEEPGWGQLEVRPRVTVLVCKGTIHTS